MNKPKEILELEKIYGIKLGLVVGDPDDTLFSNTRNCYELNYGEVTGLNLSDNRISEIKGLEKLTKLQRLYLSCTQISEIKGLEQLTQLQKLYLNGFDFHYGYGYGFNQITEIKGLEHLAQLQELNLSDNQISEIKGLEKLTQLQKLNLCENQIGEIKGLEKLTKLRILNLSHNKINEIKGLEHLIKLRELYLFNNQIKDIKPTKSIIELFEKLDVLRIHGNRFINTFYKYENNIDEVQEYLLKAKIQYEQHKIFLSYCWKNEKVANLIDSYFSGMNIKIIRDKRDLEYKQSLKEFMKTIRDAEYVIMIISKDYLESKNCMYEVSEFVKNKDFKNRIIPIITAESKIFDINEKINYFKYWENKKRELEKETKNLPPEKSIPIFQELKEYTNIELGIVDFIDTVSDMNNIVISNDNFNDEHFNKIKKYIQKETCR